MWRTALSVLLSAILGSAVATVVYASWLSIWQGGSLPHSPDNFWVAMAVFAGASRFTILGAILLAGVESALSKWVRSDRALDLGVVVFGATAGAAILGGLSPREAWLGSALLGGFYGLATAIIFVFLQRQLGSRRERRL